MIVFIAELSIFFQIKCCILFIHPVTKSVALSALPHILDSGATRAVTNFDDLAKGDIVKDAVVIKVDKLKGVYLKLNDARGYVPVSTLLFILTTRYLYL